MLVEESEGGCNGRGSDGRAYYMACAGRWALGGKRAAVRLHGRARRIDNVGTMCEMPRLEGGVQALEADAASAYSSGWKEIGQRR